MRSLSSAAAFSVKVKATIDSGGSPSASSEATRCETTSVLPEPARRDDLHVPATVRDGRRRLAFELRDVSRLGPRHATVGYAVSVRRSRRYST